MKNSTRPLTLIKKLSLSLIVLALPQIVLADDVPATVTSIQGQVTVKDTSGQTVEITQGSKLPVGDTVTTGSDGTVGLTLTPGSGTVVMPNSTVKISTLDFNKAPDGSNNRTIRLNLRNGSLISTLFKKDGHSDFQVATPYGVAAAKGTSWEVTVDGTVLTVSVANGVVIVTNPAGQVVATVHENEKYDNKTKAVQALSPKAKKDILDALQTFLPDLTKKQLIDALKNAGINPATNDSKDAINSPNN
jgi:hypothetical protein